MCEGVRGGVNMFHWVKIMSFDLSSEVNFPLNDSFKSYLLHMHGRGELSMWVVCAP